MRYKRILLAVDNYSKLSKKAALRAKELATYSQGKVNIVHALPPMGYLSGFLRDLPAINAQLKQDNSKTFKALYKQMPHQIGKTILKEGVTHEVIARTAKQQHADLIVVGHTPGHHLSSTPENLMSSMPCDVLIIKNS